MADLAWFPSAAMQTIGAMYAVFAALYIYAAKRNSKTLTGTSKTPTRSFSYIWGIMEPHIYFVILSIIVFFAILINAIVLFGVSIGSLSNPERYYFGGFILFLSALTYIILFSMLLVPNIAKK